MNFRDLAERLRTIEENTAELNIDGTAPVEECGDMPPPGAVVHEMPPQQDNVTMNVSMNGQGSGGIKSLMDILRNIEAGVEDDKVSLTAEPEIAVVDDMLTKSSDSSVAGDESIAHEGSEETVIGHDVDDDKDDAVKNRPHRVTYNVDTITRHGDDLLAKGDIKRLKMNGGENPLQEGLVERLQSLYDSIKEAKGKTMSRAAKGYEKFGPEGMKKLAQAGKDGASEKEIDAIRKKYNKYKD
jgi:hypothetical protein